MSNKQTQIYSSEFRESAVKLANESDQSIAHTARELGVNVNTLQAWIRKYSQIDSVTGDRSDAHLYEELKQLKKENARLKEERNILKKAAVYFANATR